MKNEGNEPKASGPRSPSLSTDNRQLTTDNFP
jgi:hypothetical protein